MKITVLGKSPAWQDAGGACSGYLVEEGDLRVLVDCGNGVFGKLRQVVDYVDVDAVVITHLHADHCIDLIPYSYALSYSAHARASARPRPALHVPPGGRDTFRQIAGAWNTPELVEQAFDLREYDPHGEVDLGGLTVRFNEVPHFIRTHAVQLRDGAGASFTFGADCSPNAALVDFARGTDLLMLEATLEEPEEGARGHLTAAEAGAHAREAGAGRLVLTHVAADSDLARARADAERAYGAAVEIAREGAVYSI